MQQTLNPQGFEGVDMKNNSSSSIEVKAQGSERGADKMMKYDALGSLILKVAGAIGILTVSGAALIAAMATAGFFGNG